MAKMLNVGSWAQWATNLDLPSDYGLVAGSFVIIGAIVIGPRRCDGTELNQMFVTLYNE